MIDGSPSPRTGDGADPAAAGSPLLSVNSVEVIYNHVILVLKGVSFDVPEGGIVALLGANGAGKTTTLKAVSNLLRAERGEVTKGSIEYLGERNNNPLTEGQIGDYGSEPPGKRSKIYRSTARGVGMTGNSFRYVQSYYGREIK